MKSKKTMNKSGEKIISKAKKSNISIKWWIFTPIAIMAVMLLILGATSIINLRNVNKKAEIIAEQYLESINELGDIQGSVKDLHTLALSHIVATDSETMIELVESINDKKADVDNLFKEYEKYAGKNNKYYKSLIEEYKTTKDAISNMVALSADTQNEKAFSIANNELKDSTNKMYKSIDTIITSTKKASSDARDTLKSVYNSAIVSVDIIAVLSVILFVFAFIGIQFKVILPIKKTDKSIKEIMSDIDNRQGDLTKRVKVYQNDEIGALAMGINAFIERLQNIMKTVTDSASDMNDIATEVSTSMVNSNASVTDLSAVTQELSATMTEVGNNAEIINGNVNSVSGDVDTIASKTTEINDYTKKMKEHADSMENTARENMRVTNEKVNEILEVLEKAIRESESVKQVNTLSQDILDISEQTNLLSLNASIEAARAGEAGKGFAVVATQISKLASESQEAVNRIQEINTVVTTAVNNLAEQSKELINYMKGSILGDFQSFVVAGGEYRENAAYIEGVMEEFTVKTEVLNKSVNSIAISIDSISHAISEGVNGVSSTAESMQTLAMEIDEVSRRMDENHNISEVLKKETEIFKKL